MSTFSLRCLSPCRRTSFVSIPGCCKSSQHRTSQHSNNNFYRGHYIKRSSPISSSCLCKSHCCSVRSSNYLGVYLARQRVGLKTKLPQPHQSRTLQQLHLHTWVKVKLDSIFNQLQNVTSSVSNHLGYRLRPSDQDSSKADLLSTPKSGQPQSEETPSEMLPVSEPGSGNQSIYKKDAQQQSGLQTTSTPEQQEFGLGATSTPEQQEYGLQTTSTPEQQESGLRATSTPDQQESGLQATSTPEHQEHGFQAIPTHEHQKPGLQATSTPEHQKPGLRATSTPEQQEFGLQATSTPEHQKPGLQATSALEHQKPGLQTTSTPEHQKTRLRATSTPEQQESDLQATSTPERHTLEEAIYHTNQSIISYYQKNIASPKYPTPGDNVQPRISAEEKTVQLVETDIKTDNEWNILKKIQLPSSSNHSPKKQTLTGMPREETTCEKYLTACKDCEQIEKAKRESSVQDFVIRPEHDTSKNVLLYEYIPKPAKHMKTIGTARPIAEKMGWDMLRKLMHSFWNIFRFPRKRTARQLFPVIQTGSDKRSHGDKSDVKNETDIYEEKQPSPMKMTAQGMSLYHPLTSPPRPTSKDQDHIKAAVEEEEVGWNVFRKFSIPFRDTSSPPKKKVLRRADFVSRSAVEAKTNLLVKSLKSAATYSSKMGRVKELSKHIKQCPSCRHEATELKAVPLLLRLLDSEDMAMGQEALEALALLGYTAPVKGRGIRILCLDGGGTRALISILCLKQLERLTNRKVYELFDYVCGVSTGALLATIVFLYHIPLDECERLYQDFSRKMFSRSRVIGAGGLVWNYAFYDSDQWEHILQTEIGHKTMIEFARDPVVPKVAAVSTLINTPRMRNFVFRTYNFPPDVYSQYPGSCTDQLWEVIRASSAAPGYYEDFCLDNYVHSDGGLLANNPTALAIHESNLLWPHESLQCVVSLGTGRYEPSLELGTSTKVSLKEKVTKMVDNATDTEAVHIMMADVMPPNTYFRFNPYLSEDVPLDEIRPDRLEVMKRDTTMYLRKNDGKMRKAASILRHTRLPHQMVMDWAKLKADSLF